MYKIQYTRPWLTEYQVILIDDPARFTVCEAATKCGKTASHIIWLFEKALDLKKRGAECWWVAPVYQQAKIAFTRFRNQIENKQNVHFFKVNESELTLTLPTGVVIRFKSAQNPDNLFGEDVHAVVFDEFTRAKEEAFWAIRSTITATGGQCKMIGNARGKKNWGYRLGVRARNGEAGYSYHKITIYDALAQGIPGITEDEINQAKIDLPEHVFNELYMAEPVDDASNPFGISEIRACIKPLSTLPAVAYGVDLAKYSDWTVIVGLDKNGDVCYFDRFRMDWSETRRKIIAIVGRTPAHVDSTGVGDPVVEDMSKFCVNMVGINYARGDRMKQQLMESLRSSITDKKISILAGVMQDEMEGFEFEYENGRVKFSAPSGSHDDCVNALALANDCKIKNPVRKFNYV